MPLPPQVKVKAELKRLQGLDVICPVTMPTDWHARNRGGPEREERCYPDVCRPDKSERQCEVRKCYLLPSTDQL